MVSAAQVLPPSHREAYQLAVDARDRRFDGVFFVAITTTRVYCRPICPSRLAYDRHRRFFDSAAAAERAGFRPCLRCRPELAPGAARVALGAVSQLAQAATQRIAAGALNERSVADLAGELGVSERHLRELGNGAQPAPPCTGRQLGATAQAGPKARALGGRRGIEEAAVTVVRQARRANRPAVDMRRRDAHEKDSVKPAIACVYGELIGFAMRGRQDWGGGDHGRYDTP